MQYIETEYVMHYTNRTGCRTHHYVYINRNAAQLPQLLGVAEQAAALYGFTAVSFARPRS